MSVARTPDGGFKVRWRTSDGVHRSRKFEKGEKKYAEEFHDEVRRAKRLGHLQRLEAELEGVRARWVPSTSNGGSRMAPTSRRRRKSSTAGSRIP